MIDRGPGPHPSYLELDRLALGAPGAATTEEHVAACDRCRHHVEGLRQVPPLPASLRERLSGDGVFRRWLAGRRGRVFSVTGLAGAAALAASLLWVGSHPGSRRAPALGYDGVKGLPSVWIYVKRDSELALWDGERPLAPGDKLRLKIDPQDLTHVDVFTREESGMSGAGADADAGALVSVFSGRLARGAVTTLPAAWQLDGSARHESLIVVLARRAVSAAEAKRFVEIGAPAGVWLRRFELRRAGAAQRPSEPLP